MIPELSEPKLNLFFFYLFFSFINMISLNESLVILPTSIVHLTLLIQLKQFSNSNHCPSLNHLHLVRVESVFCVLKTLFVIAIDSAIPSSFCNFEIESRFLHLLEQCFFFYFPSYSKWLDSHCNTRTHSQVVHKNGKLFQNEHHVDVPHGIGMSTIIGIGILKGNWNI